jgi:hypothetical protein
VASSSAAAVTPPKTAPLTTATPTFKAAPKKGGPLVRSYD